MSSWNLPENSELILKPLNSWMGLLEKHNIAIILLSYRLSNMNLCRFVYSEDDNSTEKTIFPFFLSFVFDFVFVFVLSDFCYFIFTVLMMMPCFVFEIVLYLFFLVILFSDISCRVL